MSDRGVGTNAPTSGGSRQVICSVDVALFSQRGRALNVLCVVRKEPRLRRELPFALASAADSLEAIARSLVKRHLGVDPAWMEQLGAFADGKSHSAGARLAVAFVGVVADATAPGSDVEWAALREVSGLPARQREMADAALSTLRTRMDHAPIAFRLLPRLFTLSELQSMYELLLGRRLHKASFRRSLLAASLVEATDEWRAKGRGRPAQFFRYSPRRRRSGPRAVRFDLLG